jgi:hypothetical protein
MIPIWGLSVHDPERTLVLQYSVRWFLKMSQKSGGPCGGVSRNLDRPAHRLVPPGSGRGLYRCHRRRPIHLEPACCTPTTTGQKTAAECRDRLHV